MRIPVRSLAVNLLTIASVFLWAIQIQAQATTASIHGTVTDPTGAVLANALVTVVNTSTGMPMSKVVEPIYDNISLPLDRPLIVPRNGYPTLQK